MPVRLGRTAVIHFITQVVVSLSGFLATYAIARFLGGASLGEYSKAVAILFIAMIPAAAIGEAVTKRMSEGTDARQYFGGGFVLMGIVLIGLLGLTWLARPYLNSYVGEPVASEFAMLLAAAAAFRLIKGVLNGDKQVARAGSVRAFERLIRTGLQVTVIILGFVVTGLIVGHAVSLLLGSLIGLALYRTLPKLPDRKHVDHLVEYAQYTWMGKTKGRVFGWTDTIVLGFFVSSTLIGIYEVAWSLSSLFILVSNSIKQTLFPEFSDLGTDRNYERIQHYLNEGLVFTAVFAIPGFVGAAMIGPRVLAIYQEGFEKGATVLLLLILARTLSAFGEQFVSAINAIDRPDIAFRISILFIVGNITLNIGLVSLFDWTGAAVATFLAASGWAVLSYAALAKLIGRPSIPWIEIGYQVAAAAVMAGALIILLGVMPDNRLSTLVTVFAGGTVYTVALVTLSKRVREKVCSLVPRVPEPNV
jgi:O-antigen/teichoic acid export membrane protein